MIEINSRTFIYDNGIVTLTGRGRARVFVSSSLCAQCNADFSSDTHTHIATLPRKIAARPRLSLSFLIFSRERERESKLV